MIMKTKSIDKKDRGFYIYDKSWYKMPDRESEITFGIYPEGGNHGTKGEMTMIWADLGQYGLAPQLRCFNDAFIVLDSFNDLISELKAMDSTDFSQDDFVAVLLKCGFRDLTKYERE